MTDSLARAAADHAAFCEAQVPPTRDLTGFELLELADALRRVEVPARSLDNGRGRAGTTRVYDDALGQYVRDERLTLCVGMLCLLIGAVVCILAVGAIFLT